MKSKGEELVNEYLGWLKERITIQEIDDWTEITTPFLDRHNDYLQIYVKFEKGKYILTDDSYIINDLITSGCDLTPPKRQALLKLTANGLGIRISKNNALLVESSKDEFPSKKHNLIQAMIAVNDLFYLASPIVRNLFYEDVMNWLELSDVRYSPKVTIVGKSGFNQTFDFLIPKSKSYPERLIRTINRPSKETAESYILAWLDTVEMRKQETRAYAILNDNDLMTPQLVTSALTSYDINPILWSDREKSLIDLVN